MERDVNKIISNVSIRGRAGFVLAIAEHLLKDLKSDSDGYDLAVKSINSSWQWVENQDISGDELFALLIDEDDDGLILHEGMADESLKNFWITLTTAILYLAWLSYEVGHVRVRPGPVHEVDDDAIDVLIEYAEKSKSFDKEYVLRLYDFIVKNYLGDSKTLGNKVDRGILLNI
jgi:hypothetical protein